jgi:tetratricopeptide (TPR) repeat protein
MTGGLNVQADGQLLRVIGRHHHYELHVNFGGDRLCERIDVARAAHLRGGWTFTVRLTVTDSLGRTGTNTAAVTSPLAAWRTTSASKTFAAGSRRIRRRSPSPNSPRSAGAPAPSGGGRRLPGRSRAASGYASARVTLGRALLELNDLDRALVEFEHVLRSAPDNLAAIRSLADIHRRQGSLALALEQYRAALALARNDPDLQEIVAELAREVEPAMPEPDVQAARPRRRALAADQPTASGAQSQQVIARLEQWLDAINVARAQPRS